MFVAKFIGNGKWLILFNVFTNTLNKVRHRVWLFRYNKIKTADRLVQTLAGFSSRLIRTASSLVSSEATWPSIKRIMRCA